MNRRARHAAASRFGSGLRWAGTLALLGAICVWIQLQAKELRYDLAAARDLSTRLAEENKKFSAEWATITSIGVVDEAARGLSLRPAREGEVVSLR